MEAPRIDGRKDFRLAVLTDGTQLDNVTLTRATGYDVTVWVTDGKTFAPVASVTKLEAS